MADSKFFNFFPIPAFLHMPAAGVSISDVAVRFIQFTTEHGDVRVLKYGEVPIPAGVVVGGHISQKEEMVKVLAELKKKYGLHLIRLALPDEKIYIFKTALPNIPHEEVRSALEFKIEQNVPISVSEAVFDYMIENHPPDAESIEVIVGVMSESDASDYSQVVEAAGLVPVAFEIESQAIANAIVAHQEATTVLIVNCEVAKTSIYLVHAGLVHFSSTIAHEVSTGGESAGAGAPVLGKINMAKYGKFPIINEEIDRLMSYWRERGSSVSPELNTILLCGTEVTDNELVGYFTNLVKKEVVVANVWTNLPFRKGYIPDIPQSLSLAFAAAIGAGSSDFVSKHV